MRHTYAEDAEPTRSTYGSITLFVYLIWSLLWFRSRMGPAADPHRRALLICVAHDTLKSGFKIGKKPSPSGCLRPTTVLPCFPIHQSFALNYIAEDRLTFVYQPVTSHIYSHWSRTEAVTFVVSHLPLWTSWEVSRFKLNQGEASKALQRTLFMEWMFIWHTIRLDRQWIWEESCKVVATTYSWRSTSADILPI